MPPIEFGNCTSYTVSSEVRTYFVNSIKTRLSQTQKQARHQGTITWENLLSELKEVMSYTNFYDALYNHFMFHDFCIYCVCVISYCVYV